MTEENKFNTVKDMLGQVSTDIKQSKEATTDKIDDLFDVMDDLAANVLAVQAIVSAICKKYPVEVEDVNAWIEENMDMEGEGADKASMLAKYLIGEE